MALYNRFSPCKRPLMRSDLTLARVDEGKSPRKISKEKMTMITKKQLLAAPAVLGLMVMVSRLMAETDNDAVNF